MYEVVSVTEVYDKMLIAKMNFDQFLFLIISVQCDLCLFYFSMRDQLESL
jgi:hypothetical protein